MLSLTVNSKSFSLSSPFLHHHPQPPPQKTSHFKPISAIILPSSSNPYPSSSQPQLIIPSSSSTPSLQQQQQLYQPFRPPPSPLPSKYRNLDIAARLDILTNRLGLWFEYAPLITSLAQEGFIAPTIEELTGISGVEQNCLVVAAKVRESLVESKLDPEILQFFDAGGAELLYEIRLLSATQRVAAATYAVVNNLDAKGAQELARAIKDFPKRRGDSGWEHFNYTLPEDCLSYMYYRQSLEYLKSDDRRKTALEKALEVAGSDKAINWVKKELEDRDIAGKEMEAIDDGVRVPVVRMKVGEVAEATRVVVLPVCRAEERENEVVEAPWECGSVGEFGVVTAEKGWRSWVVLPGWEPVAGLKNGGVAVAFGDATILPWSVKRYYMEEAILVVADRGRKEVVADGGFYLVVGGGNGGGNELKVERGGTLKQMGVKESLGTVVLVVRPLREENDELSDEDWE